METPRGELQIPANEVLTMECADQHGSQCHYVHNARLLVTRPDAILLTCPHCPTGRGRLANVEGSASAEPADAAKDGYLPTNFART